MHALLISSNQRLISEFKKFVAVTQSELVVSEVPEPEQIKQAYRIFVDQDFVDVEIIHRDVVIVSIDALGAKTWELAMRLSANHVAVVSDSREWLIEHLSAPAIRTGKCIAVIPGCGGAGASTVASALAFHANALVETVSLVDCDQSSAGIDIVAGAERTPGMRWQDFVSLTNSITATDIVRGLPNKNGISILSSSTEPNSISTEEVKTIVSQLLTVNDLVILDLPRSEGLVRESELIAMADAVLVVVPSTVRGCASADRVIANVTENNETVELVVRTIPGSGLTPIEIAHSLNTPLAGSVNTDTRILEQIEQGYGISAIQLGGFTRSMNAIANRLLATSEHAFAA